MLVLNSPHNPTGKVFTLAEMEAIAEIVRAHPNLIVISDEVYKFSVYNPLELGDSTSTGHYHFARLPGKYYTNPANWLITGDTQPAYFTGCFPIPYTE
jgi:aspartate/methionine/tyrosine aminotransferase